MSCLAGQVWSHTWWLPQTLAQAGIVSGQLLYARVSFLQAVAQHLQLNLGLPAHDQALDPAMQTSCKAGWAGSCHELLMLPELHVMQQQGAGYLRVLAKKGLSPTSAEATLSRVGSIRCLSPGPPRGVSARHKRSQITNHTRTTMLVQHSPGAADPAASMGRQRSAAMHLLGQGFCQPG